MIRQQPRKLPRLLAALALALLLGVCVFRALLPALLPVFVLLCSLSEYLLPIHYTLTEQSASARYGLAGTEIRWADVRHAYLTPDGIKLSPLREKNSRWEPLRGVFLRFDAANREPVIAAVRGLLGQEETLHG